jgi:hypothetical protein
LFVWRMVCKRNYGGAKAKTRGKAIRERSVKRVVEAERIESSVVRVVKEEVGKWDGDGNWNGDNDRLSFPAYQVIRV